MYFRESGEDEDGNFNEESTSEDSTLTNEKIKELTCKKLELETKILEIQLDVLKKR